MHVAACHVVGGEGQGRPGRRGQGHPCRHLPSLPRLPWTSATCRKHPVGSYNGSGGRAPETPETRSQLPTAPPHEPSPLSAWFAHTSPPHSLLALRMSAGPVGGEDRVWREAVLVRWQRVRAQQGVGGQALFGEHCVWRAAARVGGDGDGGRYRGGVVLRWRRQRRGRRRWRLGRGGVSHLRGGRQGDGSLGAGAVAGLGRHHGACRQRTAALGRHGGHRWRHQLWRGRWRQQRR
mmetsp:Transcript_16915/g.43434  ORF Transcript_16915/g.43434 Transcript_16915/m.43434 type:complete len:235 (+) Transcript_16915:576-1280(+)